MPHFIILDTNGKVEDYSVDPENSPPITSYADFPVTGEGSCGVFDSITMKLVMRYKVSILQKKNFININKEFVSYPHHLELIF